MTDEARQRGAPEQAEHHHRDLSGTIEALRAAKKRGELASFATGIFATPLDLTLCFTVKTDDTIDVIRVLHQRMDIERHP
ncbi:type II toxin-antitoxin system RelE/ParE family toxin [Burkholderia arboris]|uniref:type II toxin-antitoxin system RelE/ParE family toxin n=1 Tax=Burkholderia arboris TaxID=488730 RepID=UPI001CF5F99B|nr:type II toxin-antitoxin system RelE/ParE family toxin [Burkholderia arboris]MCA8035483.1 type II toxin-antitoxin system RelE/ParE family toxin [Burkholderia arboris]